MKRIMNNIEFINESKTSYEKVQELKNRIIKRNGQIDRTDDYRKKKKLEIRNKIDYYKIKIENYREFINKQLS